MCVIDSAAVVQEMYALDVGLLINLLVVCGSSTGHPLCSHYFANVDSVGWGCSCGE